MRGRRPDKPGTFKVRPARSGAGFLVSGLTLTGERVKLHASSKEDGERIGRGIFNVGISTATDSVVPPTVDNPGTPSIGPAVDGGWSLPKIDDATTGVFGQPGNNVSLEEEARRRAKAEQEKREKDIAAKARIETLCEFFGVAIASADAWASRRLTEAIGKVPNKPSIQNMNKVADAWEDALTASFGNRKIGPWTLALLVTIAMPVSMMLTSPAKPKEIEAPPKPVTPAGPASPQSTDDYPKKLTVV